MDIHPHDVACTSRKKTKQKNSVQWFGGKVTSKITSEHKGTHVKLGHICYSTITSLCTHTNPK